MNPVSHLRRPRSLLFDTRYQDAEPEENLIEGEDCESSNDPAQGDDSNSSEPIHLCNLHEYLCFNSSDASAADIVQLMVPYEYKLMYNSSIRLDLIRDYLEEAMLRHVATATNTIHCVSSRRRRLQQQVADGSGGGGVIGVSSNPQDLPDKIVPSCSNVSEIECISVLGAMTVYLPTNQYTDGARKAVLDLVQSGMDRNLYTYPGAIEQVSFLESRVRGNSTTTSSPASDSTTTDAVADSVAGLSTMALALIAVAVFGVLLCCGIGLVLLVQRQRQQKRETRAAIDLEDDEFIEKALAIQDSLALKPQQKVVLRSDDFDSVASPPPDKVPGLINVMGRTFGTPNTNDSDSSVSLLEEDMHLNEAQSADDDDDDKGNMRDYTHRKLAAEKQQYVQEEEIYHDQQDQEDPAVRELVFDQVVEPPIPPKNQERVSRRGEDLSPGREQPFVPAIKPVAAPEEEEGEERITRVAELSPVSSVQSNAHSRSVEEGRESPPHVAVVIPDLPDSPPDLPGAESDYDADEEELARYAAFLEQGDDVPDVDDQVSLISAPSPTKVASPVGSCSSEDVLEKKILLAAAGGLEPIFSSEDDSFSEDFPASSGAFPDPNEPSSLKAPSNLERQQSWKEDYSNILSRSVSEDFDADSNYTPRRMLQMT